MSEKPAFYQELFLHSENESKVTMNEQQNASVCVFHILTEEPMEDWNQANTSMVEKIVNLCGFQIKDITIQNINNSFEISQCLQRKEIETILCFVSKELSNRLHFAPHNDGFTTFNKKNIIILPKVSDFANNQAAKKHLWQAIKTTFSQP